MFFGMSSGTDIYGRAPTDDFWYSPIGGASKSGQAVNTTSAMRLATVYACVRVISEDIGKLPLLMYRRGKDGSRERVFDHPLVKLLANPIGSLSGHEWREMGQSHIELRGNAYNRIIYGKGTTIKALRPLHPDIVTPILLPDYSLNYIIRDPSGNAANETLVQEEVLHVKSMCTMGPVGLNPIEANKESIGESLGLQDYSASFWRNDARPGMWLKHPGSFKDPQQRDEFVKRFQAKYAGNGRGSVFLSEHDIDLKTIEVKNTDAQFIESRRLQRETIAAIFRVPQHKVGILTESTNNNIEQQAIEYVVDTLMARCNRWEERISLQLLSESDREEYFVEFQLAALLRGDTLSRYEAFGIAINSGWMLRSEARQFENMNPVPGLDRPLMPLNSVTLDAQGNPPAVLPPSSPTPAPTPGTSKKPGKSRAEALALAAAGRVVRKEVAAITKIYERGLKSGAFVSDVAAFYATHAAYVAESMAFSVQVADGYIERQCAEIIAASTFELETGKHLVLMCLGSWATGRAEQLAALSDPE